MRVEDIQSHMENFSIPISIAIRKADYTIIIRGMPLAVFVVLHQLIYNHLHVNTTKHDLLLSTQHNNCPFLFPQCMQHLTLNDIILITAVSMFD